MGDVDLRTALTCFRLHFENFYKNMKYNKAPQKLNFDFRLKWLLYITGT
jgi:hypothetical protein